MNKAVKDGVLQHVSATQISNFVACPRLWYYDKVAGLTPPQTFAQSAGDSIHQQAEKYFGPDRTPVTHEALRKALAELPAPGVDVLAEHPRDYNLGLKAAGVDVKGRIDLLHLACPGVVSIIDFKTKSASSFKRFCKTVEQLTNDLQMNIYGKYCVDAYAARDLTFVHVNINRDSDKVKLVEATRNARDVSDAYETLVVSPVLAMKQVAQLTSVETLPTMENASHKPCWAYGGCAHRERCFGLKTQTTGVGTMFDELPSGGVHPSLDVLPPTTVPVQHLVQQVTSTDFILYIDCLPLKGVQASPLEDLIAKKAAIVCEAKKVTDVREVKFAEGTSALIALMKKETLMGPYTVSSTGLGGLVSEALVPMAKVVIRGVR